MHHASIRELSDQIRTGKLSPVEIVEACLARIDGALSSLNAFITVLGETARAEAKAAEEEIKFGRWRGPLHGIPVAVKDFYDLQGVETTAGSEHFRGRVASSDAEAVKRLKRAGAIILGKTNMDALGMATTGLTSFFGPVHNPRNGDYVTGGSSAGSAAAVAAGLCYATVDTDAVGSVRLPAACCGVVGFKGSYDLISTKGILGDEPVDDFIRWMAHAGVTTRSAEDAAFVLDILSDRGDQHFVSTIGNPNKAIRIGIGNNVTIANEARQAIGTAVTTLKNAGYWVVDAPVPFGDPTQESFASIANDRATISDQAFSNVDAIILPTLESAVPTVGEASKNPAQGIAAENTAFANYYGLPAVSMPCGLDIHGMPVGLQIVGKPGADQTVLDLAHQFEQATRLGAGSLSV